MNFIKKVLLSVSLAMLPSYSCYAHVYDVAEITRAIQDPDAYEGLINKEEITLMKPVNDEDGMLMYVLMKDIENALEYKVNGYEDNNIKIIAKLSYAPTSLDKGGKYPENCVKLANFNNIYANSPMFKEKNKEFVYLNWGVQFYITNKTSEVMEIDFSKSSVSINTKSIALYDSKDRMDRGTKKDLLIPKIIAPNDTLEQYVDAKAITIKGVKVVTGNYLLTDMELMGDYNMLVNGKEVPFNMSAVLHSEKMHFGYNQ